MHYLKLYIVIFVWVFFSSFNLFSQSNLNINGGFGMGKIIGDNNYSNYSSLWKPNFSLGLSHNLFVDDSRYISSGIYFNKASAKKTSQQQIQVNSQFVTNDFSISSSSAFAGLGVGLGLRKSRLDFNIELRLLYLFYNHGHTNNLKVYDYSIGQIISADEKWNNFYVSDIDLGLNFFLGYEVIPNLHIGISNYIGLPQMSQTIYNSDITGIREIEGDNINIQASVKYDLWGKNKADKQEKNTLQETDKYNLDSISKMFVLKTYPLLYLSEVNLGFEFISNGKFSHEIIAAYHFNDSYTRNLKGLYLFSVIEEAIDFSKISPIYGLSIRYNFSLLKRKKANLWSNRTFQLMLKRTEFEDLETGDEEYYEKFDLSKTVIGFKFLPSISTIVGKHFYINYYYGIGLRFIFQTKNSFLREYRDYDSGEVIVNDNVEISKGVSYMPTLHLGISLGYIFHKK